MAIRRRPMAEASELFDDPLWVVSVLEQAKSEKADPVSDSSLAHWLKMGGWTKDEGILVLAGIDPKSLVLHGEMRNILPGAPYWEFDTAQPFSQPPHFTLEPYVQCSRATYPGDDDGFDSYVQRAEEVNAILDFHRNVIRALCHVLARSEDGLGDVLTHDASGRPLYGPARFIAWARSIKYEIPWLPWAESAGLVGADDTRSPFVAPFFDADSDDYPLLLAVAVRAWEHARMIKRGTPKQVVLDFLAARYPSMALGSRKAIAQVVNWKRVDRRPVKKSEIRG
jgi:hypothetical protein